MQAQAVRNYNAYDSAYEAGYKAALEAVAKAHNSKQHITEYKPAIAVKEQKERAEYFIKQKLAGILLLAVSAAGLAIMGSEFIMALATIPAGLFIVLTKHRIFN